MKRLISFILFALLPLAGKTADSSVLSMSPVPTPEPLCAFSIPVYPGTVEYHGSQTDMEGLTPPFATVFRVFKTANSQPLDVATVINFYTEYYKKRGWQKDVFERRGDEPYLGLCLNVYEPRAADAYVQLSGHFYLWVAPRDGMLTIHQRQWRISSLTPAGRELYAVVEGELKVAAKKMDFQVTQAMSFGNWPDYYQNQDLIDCKVFTLNARTNPPRGCLDFQKSISVTLLAYKDAAAAQTMALQRGMGAMPARMKLMTGEKRVVQRNHIVILLETRGNADMKAAVIALETQLSGNARP